MEKKGITVSSTDSFFFQFNPLYLKVDHGFAKNMKSGCSYRLVIFKGIQKVDEMAEGIKGKLIGGRILFEQTLLNFYLPIFTPTRNIEFAVKVFEAKPNEQEVEIAALKIKSGDYIKNFKNDGLSVYREETQLLDSFSLVFDLFLHNSKTELDQIVREHQTKSKVEERSRIINNRMHTPKKGNGSELSQSDISENSREGAMFNSKRKLSRKRGHDGKLRSKHGSRENSEISSREGSVKSSRKGLGPFPHTEKNEHFIHSPKKATSPKADDSSSPQKSQSPPGKTNLVSIARKASNASEISKPKQAQTPTKTARIESNIERSQSARKNTYTQRSSNILPTETPVVTRREPLSKREEASRSPAASPSKQEIHNLEIKGSSKIFEIQRRNEPATSSAVRYGSNIEKPKPADPLPPKNPGSRLASKTSAPAQKEEVQLKIDNHISEAIISSTPIATEAATVAEPEAPQSRSQTLELAKQEPEKVEATTPQQQATAQINEASSERRAPSAKQASLHSKSSRPGVPQIAVKSRPVLMPEQGSSPQKLKQSANLKHTGSSQSPEEVKIQVQSTQEKLFYVFFFIASVFLFYNAVTPSRRV